MGNSICRMVVVALISAWMLAAANSAKASYASIVGTEVAYCSASWGYPANPDALVIENFELSPEYCSASILLPLPEDTTVEGHPSSRSVHGSSWYICEGDILLEALMSVSGARVSPGLIVVSGEYLFDFNFIPPDCGSAEIALIRFSGDPAVFDGLAPKTVYDLVNAGLISEGEILLVHTEFPELPPTTPPFSTPFSFEVPVGDIPDGEIYLFSTVQTPLPEPVGPNMLLAGALGLYGLARIKAHRR